MKINSYLFLALLLSGMAWITEAADNLQLTFKTGDDIRQLAATHLQNPDLWPDILYANQLSEIHELQIGMTLKIPVKLILAVDNSLKLLQKKIQQANQQGARILAKDAIIRAIKQQNQAFDKRQAGEWQASLQLVNLALKDAEIALDETENKRYEQVQALLEQAKGKVQRRKDIDLYWHSVKKGSLLGEMERLRTLANSYALVRFRDDSKLQLAADTQIIIRKMRQDRLNKEKSTGIVLYKGDLQALLGGKSDPKQFDVKIKGIETKIKSRQFWMNKQEKRTLFANYDGEIEVSAAGSTVILKTNQGTVVKENQKPMPAKNLLPMPKPLQPENYATVYGDRVTFNWKPQIDAQVYQLDMARDRYFNDLVTHQLYLQDPPFFLPVPETGLYYWRLAGIDADGLLGVRSKTRFFKIEKDMSPPYLIITSPKENSIVRHSSIKVLGKTEQNAVLAINKQIIKVSKDGSFQFNYPLQVGLNKLILIARDPAGNETKLLHSFNYMPDDSFDIRYNSKLIRKAKKHFVTRQSVLTLTGQTKADSQIELKTLDGKLFKTTTDKQGNFQFNLPLHQGLQKFNLVVISPSGFKIIDTFIIELDQISPIINLSSHIPERTAKAQLLITGKLEGTKQLSINNKILKLYKTGNFSNIVNLKAGYNEICLLASDIAGNRSRWQKTVFLDQKPPSLVKYELLPKRAKGGDSIQLIVYAQDKSGLKVSAAYSLKVADITLSGYLRLSSNSKYYYGQIPVPLNIKGLIKLESLRLEDYLGNEKTYFFE
jgi:hypothetical protein